MLGADPEFVVCDPRYGSVREAQNVIVRECSPYNDWDAIGWDGAASTGELRPEPAETPEVLFSNVDALITRLGARYPMYHFYAGSFREYPLGGHLHFSDVERTDDLLNKLLEFLVEPLNSVSAHSDRRHCGYGDRYDVRGQEWGWEYRAPCSWLSHPTIARGVLEIAATLAAHHDRILLKNDLLEHAANPEVIKDFYTFIDKLHQDRERLENIEILTAWGKRKEGTAPKTVTEATTPDREVQRTNESIWSFIPSGRLEDIQLAVGATRMEATYLAAYLENNSSRLHFNLNEYAISNGRDSTVQTLEWHEPDHLIPEMCQRFVAACPNGIPYFSDLSVMIAGAHRNRTSAPVIFLASNLWNLAGYTREDAVVDGIHVREGSWLSPNVICLSHNLRVSQPGRGITRLIQVLNRLSERSSNRRS